MGRFYGLKCVGQNEYHFFGRRSVFEKMQVQWSMNFSWRSQAVESVGHDQTCSATLESVQGQETDVGQFYILKYTRTIILLIIRIISNFLVEYNKHCLNADGTLSIEYSITFRKKIVQQPPRAHCKPKTLIFKSTLFTFVKKIFFNLGTNINLRNIRNKTACLIFPRGYILWKNFVSRKYKLRNETRTNMLRDFFTKLQHFERGQSFLSENFV